MVSGRTTVEDGNGRIARLLMNYIFLKHDYPMIVIRSKGKKQYLDALGKADKMVGPVPSDGAQASLEEARDFVPKKTIVNTKYFVISKILHTFGALFERLAFVL